MRNICGQITARARGDQRRTGRFGCDPLQRLNFQTNGIEVSRQLRVTTVKKRHVVSGFRERCVVVSNERVVESVVEHGL